MAGAASAADPARNASIAVKASPAAHVRWNGRGDLTREIPLCVLSDTGGFIISIASQAAGDETGKPVDFRLEDPFGSITTTSSRAGGLAILNGTVDPADDCRGGANARLTVIFAREVLLAGVAGDLNLDLQFS
ncbi:hypothetical protein LTR94_034864, partial [Friedmanniomyces endolithicus]